MAFRRWLPREMRGLFGRMYPIPNPWLLARCGVAVLAAIVSLVLYWRARKTWYVTLNLLINAGWLFMTVALGAIIRFAFIRTVR
jgi:hypothetical protein